MSLANPRRLAVSAALTLAAAIVSAPAHAVSPAVSYGDCGSGTNNTWGNYQVGTLEVSICTEFDGNGTLNTAWYVLNEGNDPVTVRVTAAWQRWNKPWHWVHDQTETLKYGEQDSGVVGTNIGCGDNELFHGGIVINYDGNYRTSGAVTDNC